MRKIILVPSKSFRLMKEVREGQVCCGRAVKDKTVPQSAHLQSGHDSCTQVMVMRVGGSPGAGAGRCSVSISCSIEPRRAGQTERSRKNVLLGLSLAVVWQGRSGARAAGEGGGSPEERVCRCSRPPSPGQQARFQGPGPLGRYSREAPGSWDSQLVTPLAETLPF